MPSRCVSSSSSRCLSVDLSPPFLEFPPVGLAFEQPTLSFISMQVGEAPSPDALPEPLRPTRRFDRRRRPDRVCAGHPQRCELRRNAARGDGLRPRQPAGERPHVSLSSFPARFTARLHRPSSPPSALQHPRAVAPTLPAGSAVLFDVRVLHRGLANRSGVARPVLYFTYAAPWYHDLHMFETPKSLLAGSGEGPEESPSPCLSLRARLPHPKLVPFPAVLQTGGRGKALPFLALPLPFCHRLMPVRAVLQTARRNKPQPVPSAGRCGPAGRRPGRQTRRP